MRIKKLDDTFNEYKVEISFGQLVAIRDALEKDHAEPISDELYAEISYYLQNIPGPGESTEEFKAEKDAITKTGEEAGEEVTPDQDVSDTDVGLEADQEGSMLPPPPSDDAEFEEAPTSEYGEVGDDETERESAEGEVPDLRDYENSPELAKAERDIMDRAMRGGPGARPTGVRHNLPAPPEE